MPLTVPVPDVPITCTHACQCSISDRTMGIMAFLELLQFYRLIQPNRRNPIKVVPGHLVKKCIWWNPSKVSKFGGYALICYLWGEVTYQYYQVAEKDSEGAAAPTSMEIKCLVTGKHQQGCSWAQYKICTRAPTYHVSLIILVGIEAWI